MFKNLNFSAVSGYLLFWLTFIGLVGDLVYCYVNKSETALNLVPVIIGIYASHSLGKQVSAHINGRMDADADAEEVIKNCNEK